MRAEHGAFFAVRLKCDLKAGTVAVVLVMVPGVSRGAVAYPKALVQRWLTDVSPKPGLSQGIGA